MAVLIASLDKLRDEFDALWPGRDKSSDGWVGDAAHADRTSDHNPDETGAVPIHDADTKDEVHAIDVDDTLRCGQGVTMEDCVQLILSRCRSGAERRLRYVIYERRIWEADEDWQEEYYDGSNAHDQHAHFSGSYDSDDEADRSDWHLGDLMALSDADKDWINGRLAAYMGDVIPRWTREGTGVPDSDPNPTQTMSSALYEIGKDSAYARYCGPGADPASTGQQGQQQP